MRNVLKGFAVVSCVGLLAVLLAGCGGDDNGNGDSAAAPVFGDLGGFVVAATQGFQGLVGVVSCDAFGDCGNGSTNVYRHTDTGGTDPAALEVVYRFAP